MVSNHDIRKNLEKNFEKVLKKVLTKGKCCGIITRSR